MDHHTRAIDVGDLQPRQFGPAHACCVQGRENDAMVGTAGRLDKFGDLLLTQDGWQPLPRSPRLDTEIIYT